MFSADVTVPPSGGLGDLAALAVPDSGTSVSSTPEPILSQVGACLGVVQIRMPLQQGARMVRLVDRNFTLVTQSTIALQLTFHTPWNPFGLDPKCCACMPGSNTVIIVRCLISDKL